MVTSCLNHHDRRCRLNKKKNGNLSTKRKLTFVSQPAKCERTMTNCDEQMVVVGGGGELLDSS